MGASAKPDYDDIVTAIQRFSSQGKSKITVGDIGESVQCRAIPSVCITDPNTPNDDKQHVLIVASQHGSEESGRAMALETIEYLLSNDPEAAQILKKMVVAVIPCANPDGAMSDTYRNADDVDVAHTFHCDQPAGTPEGRALEAFTFQFIPDVFVDIHGMAGGSMKDRVWLIPPLNFSPNRFYLTEIARRMHAAAETAGYPQTEVAPPGQFRGDNDTIPLLGDKVAGKLNALCFGMESIEHYYREPEWRSSGIARLRALFKCGLEDTFGLGEVGFPVNLVSGNRIVGLKAHGTTAASRRSNRIALANFLQRNWAVVDRGADGMDGCARVKISSKTIDGENPDRFAIMLRIKKPCQIESIDWNAETLLPNGDHGYRLWEDSNSILIQANIQAPFGGEDRYLTVRYSSPHLKTTK